MNRWLAWLAVVEGLVIIVLAALLLTGRERAEAGPEPGGAPVAPVMARSDDGAATNDLAGSTGGSATRPAIKPLPGRAFAGRDDVSAGDVPAAAPRDPVGILVFGSVRGTGGRPVTEGWVSLTGPETQHANCQIRDGAYSIVGVSAGQWTLWCKVPDYRPFEKKILIAEAPRQQRIDVVLESAVMLQVRFQTPDGRPLGQAIKEAKLGHFVRVIAVATREPPAADLPMTTLRDHGRFGLGSYLEGRGVDRPEAPLPEGVAGTLELTDPLPLYVSAVLRHVVLATKHVPEGSVEVVFTIALEDVRRRLSGIRGRLVDAATGAPITEAKVDISDRQSSGPWRLVGPDGSFEALDLRPGLMGVTIDAPGHEYLNHYIRLAPGEILDLGRLTLAPALTVRGRVIDEEGRGVAAGVSSRNLDHVSFPQPTDLGGSTRAAVDGTFALERLGPGRHLLRATTNDQRSGFLVATLGEGSSEMVIRLARGTGARIAARLEIRPQILLEIAERGGTVVQARHVWFTSPFTWTLPRGDYTLRVYDDLALLKETPFTVADGFVDLVAP